MRDGGTTERRHDGTGSPRAILFDAGGTLIHIDYARVAGVVERAVDRALRLDGFVEAEYAGRAAVEAAMAKNGGASDATRWTIHFAAMLGALGLTEDEFQVVAPEIAREHRRRNLWSNPLPGTAEGLAALNRRGLIVGCVSNADGAVDRLLERVGLLGALRFVVDSGKVGIEKPDPRIFEIALKLAGLPAAEVVYVGDLYPVDVVGARRAGLIPVLLDPLDRYRGRDCRTTRDVPTYCRELVSLLDAA
ncbi:MAG: HAD-IA family hydrolase [Gemmatimonadetes bacterium]|nr:HAD-IA family hydrolase [Gemmatimonadota bacterium]